MRGQVWIGHGAGAGADVWATAAFVDPADANELMTTRDPGYEMWVL